MAQRSAEDILNYLEKAEVASVGTSNMGKPRQRMMHFASDERFHIYLSSMKGDPKVIQWSNIPETAMLIHQGSSFMEMEECEIIGRAEVVRSNEERQRAVELLQHRSPIVGSFVEQDAVDRLEFIKIVPSVVKYRFVPEILQGEKPTVLDMADDSADGSDKQDLRSRAAVWKEALRPLSLTASLVPVLVGAAAAFGLAEMFSWTLFILTLFAALAVQAGTNMINDYLDAERDADNTGSLRPFTGGSRMIQLGLIQKQDMGFFGIVLTAAAAVAGIGLAVVSGPLLLLLIAYGLLAGFFYTGRQGRFSFINASPGIAEFLIATTYGVAMTAGTFYIQTGFFTAEIWLLSIPVAALVTNVLLINQFPDAESDSRTDKRTLVVRIGRRQAKNVVFGLFTVAVGAVVALPLVTDVPLTFYFVLLAVPFLIQAVRYIGKYYESSATDLIPGNAHTAIFHLMTGLLAAITLIMPSIGTFITLILFAAAGGFVLWVWRYIERQRKVMAGFKKAFST
ncbi:1,4-dihydroxy-2-naphthoate octaprenyltransferase [Alkalicoccus luteus]|uniref:1,4-dihydroxy-2-naphthoate octaprenyltransferase n=1 Tax=Alkalicoccus luteus TaxID=1237094 RepID=A0A969PX95_9BACI|nr:1,4-dihydroxy-2-naphthoate octaprenyltransferase [Alkalicoccus luteus]NJP37307.1 1,4-dihydroxy-2-naphthoate octaprenyltransferase [Alkalicoccus luteus]